MRTGDKLTTLCSQRYSKHTPQLSKKQSSAYASSRRIAVVIGHKIKVFQEKFPPDVPWHRAGVQYVIEASGMFTCLEKASGHLASEGVKRVLVTAPSVDVPMVILGVNDYMLNTDHKVISCTSSTLYCLAPIIKVLNDNFGVVEGFITSIHAMTPSLKPLDGLCLRGKHWRDHRSINQNIIPATTGACKALGKILPQVKDRMTGLAFRVPIVNVSVLDITIKLDTNTSKENIIKSVEKASRRELKNIIKISNEDAVSSDFIGDSHSCILDVESSLQLRPDFYKLICWYENEFSYACRVVDAIFYSEMQFAQSHLSNTMCVHAKLPTQIITPSQNNKKVTLKCNYVTPPNDEVFYINSNESIKSKAAPKPRPLLARKPLSSQSSSAATTLINRDTKGKNEIFKVWNDDYDSLKNPVRQNRTSFFQSCITFGPKHPVEQTDCMKVQERLEDVKREFSKMLIITEDLLRKSYTSKNKLQYLKSKEMTNGDPKAELKVESFQETHKIKNNHNTNAELSNPIVKDCGDFKNKDKIIIKNDEIKDYNETKNLSYYAEVNDHIFFYDQLKKTKTLEKTRLQEPREKQHILRENTRVVKSNDTSNIIPVYTQRTEKINKTENPAINNNEINPQLMVKAIKSLTYALTNNIVENVFNELNAPSPLISKTSCEDKSLHNINFNPEKDVTSTKDLSETQKLEGYLPIKKEKTERYYIKDLTKYLRNNTNDMRIMDEELKKRNIILMNSDSNVNIFRIGSEPSASDADSDRKNLDLNKKILAGLRMVAETGIAESVSPCGSPANTVTTVSNGDRTRVKEDLYDKLDSASASDSNNSFQINERKSQVLNITDLTNSLEDLSRLDKICRIIEISDELSDKLFSSLDNTENFLEQKKKWSFRDLCERLKLDEFCNSVFGKTSF
ncbi:unnamed protein product [Arctia plantaginis]|uniref:Glyceraldehyde 3-phosphate dehydrogenase NAD(P) binding domain-containing protein n=1 Tax=Arctia plantaginis TaxID=874455 RepID=A0A8S1ASR5_ARCPL|nr:unnamed protein product [Arctia plantaginis]